MKTFGWNPTEFELRVCIDHRETSRDAQLEVIVSNGENGLYAMKFDGLLVIIMK